MMFERDQLHQVDADVGNGLAAWWIDLPGLRYRGRVVVPAEWDPERVHAALEEAARRLTYNILRSRLYSRTRLDELVPER